MYVAEGVFFMRMPIYVHACRKSPARLCLCVRVCGSYSVFVYVLTLFVFNCLCVLFFLALVFFVVYYVISLYLFYYIVVGCIIKVLVLVSVWYMCLVVWNNRYFFDVTKLINFNFFNFHWFMLSIHLNFSILLTI